MRSDRDETTSFKLITVKHDVWSVGESVIVAKSGTQTGQVATITDPEWNGRVKVKMAVDGNTRSYLPSELRKLGLARGKRSLEEGWAKITAAVSPATVVSDERRELRNKLLSDHVKGFLREEAKTSTPAWAGLGSKPGPHQKNDSKSHHRVLNTVLQKDKFAHTRSYTYLLLCLTSLASIAIGLTEVEIISANGNRPTQTTDSLKWAVSGFTALTLWLMYNYYLDGKQSQLHTYNVYKYIHVL